LVAMGFELRASCLLSRCHCTSGKQIITSLILPDHIKI
jgi:hypothetical protein